MMKKTVGSEMDYFNSKRRRVSVDDDEAGLAEYLATYVPLSNLPTPPLSSASSPASIVEVSSREWGIMSPSHQLSRLVPQKASRHPLSPEIIATYLARSQLPEFTVSLAACILDSLSSQFVRSWHRECETVRARQQAAWSARSSFTQPELIILGALAVASGFLDDVRGEPRWWANSIACGAVQVREVDATIRVILKDLDYDLCGFTVDEVENMRLELYGSVETEGTLEVKQHVAPLHEWDCSHGATRLLTPDSTPPTAEWAM